MQYYVREEIDNKALLVAADGHVLSAFDSVDDAVYTCISECRVAPLWIERNDEPSAQNPGRFCMH